MVFCGLQTSNLCIGIASFWIRFVRCDEVTMKRPLATTTFRLPLLIHPIIGPSIVFVLIPFAQQQTRNGLRETGLHEREKEREQNEVKATKYQKVSRSTHSIRISHRLLRPLRRAVNIIPLKCQMASNDCIYYGPPFVTRASLRSVGRWVGAGAGCPV